VCKCGRLQGIERKDRESRAALGENETDGNRRAFPLAVLREVTLVAVMETGLKHPGGDVDFRRERTPTAPLGGVTVADSVWPIKVIFAVAVWPR